MTPSDPKHHRARLLVGLLILLAGHVLLRGYVTDDTYIHLRYAENVAERSLFDELRIYDVDSNTRPGTQDNGRQRIEARLFQDHKQGISNRCGTVCRR